MSNYHKIMEKFWLFVAIATGMFAFYSIGDVGLEKTGVIAYLPIIALVLYLLRYFSRKRLEKKYNQDQE